MCERTSHTYAISNRDVWEVNWLIFAWFNCKSTCRCWTWILAVQLYSINSLPTLGQTRLCSVDCQMMKGSGILQTCGAVNKDCQHFSYAYWHSAFSIADGKAKMAWRPRCNVNYWYQSRPLFSGSYPCLGNEPTAHELQHIADLRIFCPCCSSATIFWTGLHDHWTLPSIEACICTSLTILTYNVPDFASIRWSRDSPKFVCMDFDG